MSTKQFVEMVHARKVQEVRDKLTAMSKPMTLDEKIAAIKADRFIRIDKAAVPAGQVSYSLSHIVFPQEREGFLDEHAFTAAVQKLDAQRDALLGAADADDIMARLQAFEALAIV